MKTPPNVCVLVAQHGIGDHYIVAGFAEAVAKRHKFKVWLAGRRELAWVSDLFPAVERYIHWPDHMRAESILTHRPMAGCYYFAHFPRMDLAHAVGFKDFHFLDAYRVRLFLRPEAELSEARLPNPEELARARSFLQQHDCPLGRTVILNIDARTTALGGVDPRYWPLLAAAFRTQGVEPFVNQGPWTQISDGLRGAPFNVADYRAIAMVAGAVCTVRSGISDLVSNLPIPQVVVYPDADYLGGPLIKGTTLTKFGLAVPPLEILARKGNVQQDVRAISQHLESSLAAAAAA
jgi:hypothetical protein